MPTDYQALTRREREKLRAAYNASRVRVDRDDQVSALVDRPRGDGGPVPWWMFVGWLEEVQKELDRGDYD